MQKCEEKTFKKKLKIEIARLTCKTSSTVKCPCNVIFLYYLFDAMPFFIVSFLRFIVIV